MISLLFVGGGLLIKQQTTKEAENLPGQIAGQKTNIINTLYPDIPLYPDAIISSVLEKNNTVVVSLQTKNDPQTILDYYQKSLIENKWLGGPKEFTKGDKKLSLEVTQNSIKTQSVIVLNYSFVPTK